MIHLMKTEYFFIVGRPVAKCDFLLLYDLSQAAAALGVGLAACGSDEASSAACRSSGTSTAWARYPAST